MKQISYEKILVSIAMISCAIIVGYNAFFIPEINSPNIIYVDKDSQEVVENINLESEIAKEEYTPEQSNLEGKTNTIGSEINGVININTASAEEISQNLDGIGIEIGTRIVEYRENNGNFKSKEDIINVSGIGDKIYDNIKDHICI